MSWIKKMYRALQMELREHKSSFGVYTTLRILVIGILFYQIYSRNFESILFCVLTLILLAVPSFLQVTLRIELPIVLEIILLLFIFAAEILGEIYEFYIIIPFWDTLLHTLNGFLMAAIGFSLVDLLNRSDKLAFELSPVFLAIVAFCFSMTIGVVWEIFEFSMDKFFAFDMQKDVIVHQISTVTLDPSGGNTPQIIRNIESVQINGTDLGLDGYLDIGLNDTMYDLIVNFIGATVFSVVGYFYAKNKNKKSIAQRFVPTPKGKEHDFLNR